MKRKKKIQKMFVIFGSDCISSTVKVFPNKVYFEVKIENIFELRENRIKINIE
jgi:hypothetical protein